MRVFELHRKVDETGVSGVGVVAQGIEFDSGWCALAWLTEYRSVAIYPSLGELIAIHGHDGSTQIIQRVEVDLQKVNVLLVNLAQDEVENIGVGLSSNGEYVWEQREAFADLFRPVRLG